MKFGRRDQQSSLNARRIVEGRMSDTMLLMYKLEQRYESVDISLSAAGRPYDGVLYCRRN